MSLFLLLAIAVLIIVGCVGALVLAIVHNKPVFLIYFQILYCCTMRFLMTEMHFPSVLRFLPDLVTMVLLVQCVIYFQRARVVTLVKAPLFTVGLFFTLAMVAFVVNAQPIAALIWGTRVVMRFFVFWVSCVFFLQEEDVHRMVRIFFFLTVGNVLAVSFQYLIQGYTFDFVSGLFGTEIGANSEMNVFLVQMFICGMAMYAFSRCSWKFLLAIVGMGLYIAAISELKVVFVELPLVFCVLLLCAGWRPKCGRMLVVGAIAIYLAGMLFFIFYPEWEGFLSLSSIQNYIGDMGYAGEGTLNRTTAVPYVFENMLTSPVRWLFGYGLGNADAASFYASEIYQTYSATRYQYFGFAHFLAENGVLGVVTYLSFYVIILAKSLAFKRRDPERAVWYVIGAMSSVLAFFYMFYSQALRVEITYIYMFWLAVPFIVWKDAGRGIPEPCKGRERVDLAV